MKLLEYSLFTLYGSALVFIFLYSMVQLHLVILYTRHKRKMRGQPLKRLEVNDPSLPVVTVQLPIYNELYVVERLIDSITAFYYPKEKLEIQVLDDSNDETVDIIAKKVAEKQAEGYWIEHIRRPERVGFKAGALQYGLERAQGEYVAIFDADFVPSPHFLLATLPYFDQDKIGAVQTRWGHINRDYSLLTKLQAFGLDAHFSLEQLGRNSAGHFINFNGTAGIWNKACIKDAGGWQADTLTEDLDLSYRAQVKGWRFTYLEGVESPAELPAAISALKSQQYRWTKGAAETARKNLGKVLRSDHPMSTKLHAIGHLLNSSVFLCIMITGLLSVPILYVKDGTGEYDALFTLASVFLVSLLSLSMFYWVSLRQHKKNGWETTLTFLYTFPVFLSFSMGLSLHNAIAVIEGYIGRKTPFIRTPKFNITSGKDQWKQNKYISKKIGAMAFIEGLLALYFIYGIFSGFWLEDWGLLPFHLMLALGFGAMFFYSVKQAANVR